MEYENILRIDQLSDKIRDNTANLNDYEEYEKLLIMEGYSKEFIMQKLKEANIESYKELIDKRNEIAEEFKQKNAINEDIRQRRRTALERRKIIEGVAVVGLVALGLALLFHSLRDK